MGLCNRPHRAQGVQEAAVPAISRPRPAHLCPHDVKDLADGQWEQQGE